MEKSLAQQTYRRAWTEYATCTDPARRKLLEVAMDGVQPDCVDSRGPGPEWEAFIATLPGYREHWDRLMRAVARPARSRRGGTP